MSVKIVAYRDSSDNVQISIKIADVKWKDWFQMVKSDSFMDYLYF